jgi:hypothetical protein
VTLAKLFGWLLIAASAGACVVMLWTLAFLLLDDPGRDPLPAILDMFPRIFVFLLAAAVSGIAYVVCRIFRV